MPLLRTAIGASCLCVLGAATFAAELTLSADRPPQDVRLTGDLGEGARVVVRVSYIESRGRTLRVFRVRFYDLPLRCADGSETVVDIKSLPQIRPLNARGFAQRSTSVEVTTGTVLAGWRYDGRLTRARRARGHVSYRASRSLEEAGDGLDCATGRLTWTAADAR